MRLAEANLDAASAARGRAELEVQLVSGESAVTSASATSPLKLLTPRARGKSVWAYSSNFGGGLVAGDETQLDLRVGPEARCFFSTQASTKVYRNPSRRPCSHITNACVDSGAFLAFLPDAVQAFAGSSYRQRQEFHLDDGAALVLLDWFTSGRVARGERWAFHRFQTRNDVFVRGQRIFVDSVLLDSEHGAIGTAHRTGRFNCFATLLLIGAPLAEAATTLIQEISSRPIERAAVLNCGSSAVQEGAVLRLAGEDIECVCREIKRHLNFLADVLGDDPSARKW